MGVGLIDFVHESLDVSLGTSVGSTARATSFTSCGTSVGGQAGQLRLRVVRVPSGSCSASLEGSSSWKDRLQAGLLERPGAQVGAGEGSGRVAELYLVQELGIGVLRASWEVRLNFV